jgi:hypothetical protein
MANLYGAYRGAGKAGGAYASSLQDIMNVGYQKEASSQSYQIQQEESDRIFGAIQQGLGLVSTIAGGMETQKEAAADITKALPGAEQTYGESKFGDFFRSAKGTEGRRGEGETRLGELGEKLSVLFGGKERKWEVPEYSATQGREGVTGGEYKQSDLLLVDKQSAWDELGMGDRGGCPDGQYKDPITQQCVDFGPQSGP